MDLGTNTFHLLIAQGDAGSYQELVHQHIAVKLGEGGINHGIIQPEPFKRGLATMQDFARQIKDNQVNEVRAIATSALRNARNGAEFINEVATTTGIQIELINGDSEAGFIYKGIQASGCLGNGNSLILDIGGGSVEFIIGNNNEILYKRSFEIGAARLMDKFHQVDPIPNKAVYELNRYLDTHLDELFKAIEGIKIDTLIGSSGSFETFAELVELEKGNSFDLKENKNYRFNYAELVEISNWLVDSSHREREAHKGIIPVRVDMIVVASLITRFVINKLGIQDVLMSTSSLKEGVLAEMLSQQH